MEHYDGPAFYRKFPVKPTPEQMDDTTDERSERQVRLRKERGERIQLREQRERQRERRRSHRHKRRYSKPNRGNQRQQRPSDKRRRQMCQIIGHLWLLRCRGNCIGIRQRLNLGNDIVV
ncbi:hypothetical protein L3X07_10010 [Levilactobacillus brevis]|nr:hypothetical protein [Levilactobacillus brevis]